MPRYRLSIQHEFLQDPQGSSYLPLFHKRCLACTSTTRYPSRATGFASDTATRGLCFTVLLDIVLQVIPEQGLSATLQQEVCVALCCSVLQYVPEHNTGICRRHCKRRSVLQCIAMCCSVLQRVAVHTRVYHRGLPATWSWIASCLELPSASDHEIRFVAFIRLDS
jgi:hypothetical protein